MSQIYRGLSYADYRALPAISSSELKDILVTPAYYKYRKENPEEPTEAMKFGTICHEAFEKRSLDDFVIAPKFDRRTTIGKQGFQEFAAANAGRTIVSEENGERLRGVFDAGMNAVKTIPAKHMGTEVSIVWESIMTDDEFNFRYQVHCKARADLVLDGGILLDWKTCDDASDDAFLKQIIKYKYHLSAAYYLDGFQAKYFVWCAIEKNPPYHARIYTASDAMLEVGRFEYKTALNIFSRCIELKKFPGYLKSPVEISLPPWYVPKSLEESLQNLEF